MLMERIWSSLGVPFSPVSSGTVTCCSISSADHEGFCVMNSTIGGDGSG